MYYLQSRYYNPEWGRFLNTDALIRETGELLHYNMFAYCINNPVNYEDSNGYFRNPLNQLKKLNITLRLYVVFRTAQTIVVSKVQDWAMRAWGTAANGINQGIVHFQQYWEKYPDRIPSLARRLGIDPSYFSNTAQGFTNFTLEALKIVKNPNALKRVVGGKVIYFQEGIENVKKGIVVIWKDGKIQSMMPSDLKSFLKLK